MTNEEFLRDVCPNHTDKSKWNKSELLHVLEKQKEQLRLHNVSHRRELLKAFLDWQQNKYPMPYDTNIEEQLNAFEAFNCG